jgi:hypothetical protein
MLLKPVPKSTLFTGSQTGLHIFRPKVANEKIVVKTGSCSAGRSAHSPQAAEKRARARV